MALKDLAIWNRKNNELDNVRSENPIESLHREVDRWFDGFFSDFGRLSNSIFSKDRFGGFAPKVDISEDDSEVSIAAELPGMEEKDINVSLKDDVLTIKGEKKVEEEKKGKEYYRVERSFGSFQRSIRVPEGVEADKIKASFKNGVLNIKMPKSEKAIKNVRQIEVKSA